MGLNNQPSFYRTVLPLSPSEVTSHGFLNQNQGPSLKLSLKSLNSTLESDSSPSPYPHLNTCNYVECFNTDSDGLKAQ